MSFFSKASGVLGINARNLHYIQKFNSRASKRFADDKIYTKTFLQSRDIGVAKMFHVIKSYAELEQLNFNALPSSFVVKPNHGFAGDGILVIKDKTKSGFVQYSGKKLRFDELFLHIAAILDGKYALSGSFDQAIIEERLEVNEEIEPLMSYPGLPDVRVIVFNYVPVLAMLRLPTVESEGKGNLELGAIGLGIDITTGKTTYGYQSGKFIQKLPNGDKIAGFQIPHWEEILLSASKIQQSTNIGYLGADIVLSKTGIKVLEVNARPGLKIQICNRVPLRARLNQVKEYSVVNPEKGVELAKRLFTKKARDYTPQETLSKPIIGLTEPVILYKDGVQVLKAKIDPYADENLINSEFNNDNEAVLDLSIQNKRMKLPAEQGNTPEGIDLILAGKYLGDFLIDVTQKNEVDLSAVNDVNEKMLLNLDRKISELDQKIAFMSYFKPLNGSEVKEAFLKYKNFNPQFEYKETPLSDFDDYLKEINKLPRDIDHKLMPIYEEKIHELQMKMELIKSRDTLELGEISEKMFGEVNYDLYRQAVDDMKKMHILKDDSRLLNSAEVHKRLEKFLAENNLEHWQIKIKEDAASNMSVSKRGIIFVREDAKITENHLKSLIAHEIETHVYRGENAKAQKYKIFGRGTAEYLETEEGLAIYNQNHVDGNQGDRVKRALRRIVGAFMGKKMSFLELFRYSQDVMGLDDEAAWRNCLRVKRGLKDTGLHTAFTKDTIYYTGLKKIQAFINSATKEDIELLYSTKMALKYYDLLKSYELARPKYISRYLKNKFFS